MEARLYAHLFRRWLPLIVALPLLAALTAGIISLRLPKVYEAHANVLVKPAQPFTGTDASVAYLTSDQIARTYSQLMVEPPVLEKVLTDLHLNMSIESLNAEIKVSVDSTAPILLVAVRDRDPAMARAITDRLIADFMENLKQIQEASSQVASARDNLILVSGAARSTPGPVAPNVPLNTGVAALSGFLLALALAFLVEYLDQSVKTEDDVRDRLHLVPIGAIPIAAVKSRSGESEIFAQSGDSASAEAYRMLRTNIQFSSLDRPTKTIVVTSPGIGEGKSRTAVNLAVALANSGARTVLVDADFRRPRLYRILGVRPGAGVSDLVLRDLPESAVIQPTSIPNLHLMHSGTIPPDPPQVLGSVAFRSRLAALREAADYVVLDTPPINVVADAAVIAAAADATILVVEVGRTTHPALRRARDAVQAVGGTVLGVVLNQATTEREYYGKYHREEPTDVPPAASSGSGQPRRVEGTQTSRV